MKTRENLAKEFEEKFLAKTFDSYQGWTIQDLEEVLSFISSQRVADLEAVMGMIEGMKHKEDDEYNCPNCGDSDYNNALSDLLAKLDEVKGLIK